VFACTIDGIAAKDPKGAADALMNKCSFKLKGAGPASFRLGCDFFHGEHGCLCMAPRKHIEKMVVTCEQMFGVEPRQGVASLLNKGDHPEVDASEELGEEGVTQHNTICTRLSSLRPVVGPE
jgi:hypothetical protein